MRVLVQYYHALVANVDREVGRIVAAPQRKYVRNSAQIDELYDLENDPQGDCQPGVAAGPERPHLSLPGVVWALWRRRPGPIYMRCALTCRCSSRSISHFLVQGDCSERRTSALGP